MAYIVPNDNVFGLHSFVFADFIPQGKICSDDGGDYYVNSPWSDCYIVVWSSDLYSSSNVIYFTVVSKTFQNGITRVTGPNYEGNSTFTYGKYTYNDLSVWQATICSHPNDGMLYTDYPVNDFGDSVIPIPGEPPQLPEKMAWLMVYGGYDNGYRVTYDLTNCSGENFNPSTIPPSAVYTSCNFTADAGYNFTSSSVYIDGTGATEGLQVLYVWNHETGELRIGVISSDITIHVSAYNDPYADIDGEGDIPGSSKISEPPDPVLSATSTGMLGLFAPSQSIMRQFSDYMWTDFGGSGTTTEDILKEVVQALKRIVANPLNYVTGLNIIPSQGLKKGSSTEVRFGFVNSGISMPRLTSQYFKVDCGSLSFDALCGDTFLDYAPYSKFSIYLPYIGVKAMDANDFVGHTIKVTYKGDVITGGITAYVFKDDSVMYQFSGCCALNVPLSADSWGATISGAVQVATSAVAGAVTSGSAGVAAAAARGAASVAANPSLLSPQIARSGAVSGGAGCVAVQKPFVIREAVRFHTTQGFNHISGYPSYYYKRLSQMHGYTECYDVHISGTTAIRAEVDEIETLLRGGVIL